MKSVSLITGGLSFLLSACSAGGGDLHPKSWTKQPTN